MHIVKPLINNKSATKSPLEKYVVTTFHFIFFTVFFLFRALCNATENRVSCMFISSYQGVWILTPIKNPCSYSG